MSEKKPKNVADLDERARRVFFDQFEAIFTDCDGVLVRESEPIKGASALINRLVASGKKVFVVSNNNQVTRESLLAKLTKLGFRLTADNVLTSAHLVAKFLHARSFDGAVYVVGAESIGHELDSFGIRHVGIGRDDMSDSLGDYFGGRYALDERVGCVAVGLDPFFSLPKLVKAMNYLRDPAVLFVATNGDVASKFPGFVFPDARPLVEAIESGSGRRATVIGKPATFAIDLTVPAVERSKILMIGDRLSVDVAFGNEAGVRTLWVQSGDDHADDLKAVVEGARENCELLNQIPDYFAESVGLFS